MSEDKKPPLSFEDVQEIPHILEKSTFNELRLDIGGLPLRLWRGGAQLPVSAWEDAEPATATSLWRTDPHD